MTILDEQWLEDNEIGLSKKQLDFFAAKVQFLYGWELNNYKAENVSMPRCRRTAYKLTLEEKKLL